jgi:hypothetical protein
MFYISQASGILLSQGWGEEAKGYVPVWQKK